MDIQIIKEKLSKVNVILDYGNLQSSDGSTKIIIKNHTFINTEDDETQELLNNISSEYTMMTDTDVIKCTECSNYCIIVNQNYQAINNQIICLDCFDIKYIYNFINNPFNILKNNTKHILSNHINVYLPSKHKLKNGNFIILEDVSYKESNNNISVICPDGVTINYSNNDYHLNDVSGYGFVFIYNNDNFDVLYLSDVSLDNYNYGEILYTNKDIYPKPNQYVKANSFKFVSVNELLNTDQSFIKKLTRNYNRILDKEQILKYLQEDISNDIEVVFVDYESFPVTTNQSIYININLNDFKFNNKKYYSSIDQRLFLNIDLLDNIEIYLPSNAIPEDKLHILYNTGEFDLTINNGSSLINGMMRKIYLDKNEVKNKSIVFEYINFKDGWKMIISPKVQYCTTSVYPDPFQHIYIDTKDSIETFLPISPVNGSKILITDVRDMYDFDDKYDNIVKRLDDFPLNLNKYIEINGDDIIQRNDVQLTEMGSSHIFKYIDDIIGWDYYEWVSNNFNDFYSSDNISEIFNSYYDVYISWSEKTLEENYSSIIMTFSPYGISEKGAKWRFKGTDKWFYENEKIDVPYGKYIIEYSYIDKTTKPMDVLIHINDENTYLLLGKYDVGGIYEENTGKLKVESIPSGIGSKWRIKDTYYWYDSGEEILLESGNYIIEFNDVDECTEKPQNEKIILNRGERIKIVGSYFCPDIYRSGYGYIQIRFQTYNNIGGWRIKDEYNNYFSHNYTLLVPIGTYTIEFMDISDCITPSDIIVDVNENQTTLRHILYSCVRFGSLSVKIEPEVDGAMWRIVGTEEWQESYDGTPMILPIGQYEVEFNEVDCHVVRSYECHQEDEIIGDDVVGGRVCNCFKPMTTPVYIKPDEISSITGYYRCIPLPVDCYGLYDYGLLYVLTWPYNINSKWMIKGRPEIYHNDEMIQLESGQYEIEFLPVEKCNTPDNIITNVYGGRITFLDDIKYNCYSGGYLNVNISPLDVNFRWRLLGSYDIYDNGETINLDIGQYEIEFIEYTCCDKPDNVGVVINEGQTVSINKDYECYGGCNVKITNQDLINYFHWGYSEVSDDVDDTISYPYSHNFNLVLKYGYYMLHFVEIDGYKKIDSMYINVNECSYTNIELTYEKLE